VSVITEFTIPAEAFALQETFERYPDATVEVERLATHSREWIMPFLWVSDSEMEAVERALRADPSIDEFERIALEGNTGQFKIGWNESLQQFIDQIIDKLGIVQEAKATNGTWYLRLKFVDREAVRNFQEDLHARSYDFELQRIYDGTISREREYDLTPEQHEALVTALQNGYFTVPREAQIGDLAAELGISTNAVSQRLRRATRNLTKNALTIAEPEELATSE